MTKLGVDTEERGAAALHRCHWCRWVLPPPAKTGRPRKYCKQSCRQWDWVARQRSRELDIGENELVIATWSPIHLRTKLKELLLEGG